MWHVQPCTVQHLENLNNTWPSPVQKAVYRTLWTTYAITSTTQEKVCQKQLLHHQTN